MLKMWNLNCLKVPTQKERYFIGKPGKFLQTSENQHFIESVYEVALV